jgi:hypothetical protein
LAKKLGAKRVLVVTFKQPLNNSTLNLATANPFTFGVSVTLLDGGTAPASLTSVPLTIPNWRSVVGPLTRMAGNDFTVALPLEAPRKAEDESATG